MSIGSPKIAFSTAPGGAAAAPSEQATTVQHDAPAPHVDYAPTAEEYAATEPQADWHAPQKPMTAKVDAAPEPHSAATFATPETERLFASLAADRDAAVSVPQAPAFAVAGMATPCPDSIAAERQGFLQRNGIVVAMAAIVVLTFMLGITTALLFSGNSQRAALPQSAPLPAADVSVQGLDEAVTRAALPDFTDLGKGHENPVVADLAVAVLEGLTPQRTVGTLTQDELAQKAAQAEAILNNNKLRMLREGVLAGVYKVETMEEGGFQRVKLETINANMTSDSVANLLEQAASDGRIEVPASLKTADGGLDINTMMFNLVQTSLANDGTVEGAEAAREMSRQVFAASTARTEDIGGKRIYTVEPGDSLAYISLQFYGKPSAFQRIFEANRDTLQSPDMIQVGQRLIIPS